MKVTAGGGWLEFDYTDKTFVENFLVDFVLFFSEFFECVEDDTKDNLNEKHVDNDEKRNVVEISAPIV